MPAPSAGRLSSWTEVREPNEPRAVLAFESHMRNSASIFSRVSGVNDESASSTSAVKWLSKKYCNSSEG